MMLPDMLWDGWENTQQTPAPGPIPVVLWTTLDWNPVMVIRLQVVCGCMLSQWQVWVVATETYWPAKTELSDLFHKNVCQPPWYRGRENELGVTISSCWSQIYLSGLVSVNRSRFPYISISPFVKICNFFQNFHAEARWKRWPRVCKGKKQPTHKMKVRNQWQGEGDVFPSFATTLCSQVCHINTIIELILKSKLTISTF